MAGTTHYTYDALGVLMEARYPDGQEELRLADAVGNLFRTPPLSDRRYGAGGQLRQAGGTRYRYDAEGNLLGKTAADGQQWQYSWDGAGQLVSVRLPSGYQVTFTYDALGRRVAKRYRGRVSRWVWASNVPLHEWQELEVGPGAGSVHDLSTWLFAEDSFAPMAKLTAQGAYSVVADYLGTPLALYDAQGQLSWALQLDGYGTVRQGRGQAQDCPFRYQGQYEDTETGLYYNRHRYYDPETGQYISQDPIRLNGGLRLYGYVHNTTSWLDEFGLAALPGVDFAGHPDLFPTTGPQRNIVKIKMQGRRGLDFTQAHNEAQITRAEANGYTWHHLHDFDPATGETTMQLVKTDTHIDSFPHKGSAGQFADHFGVKYDSREAIEISKQQGWHSSCP